MTIPIESTAALIESILSTAAESKWSPMKHWVPPENAIAMQCVGPTWKIVVVRWSHADRFHFEGVATSVASSPLLVRLPPADAEKAWGFAERNQA